MLVVPSEVAAWAKFRFGQVSPGTEACQFTNTANSLASRDSTGACSSEKHRMTAAGSGTTGLDACVTRRHNPPSLSHTHPRTRNGRLSGRRGELPAIFNANERINPFIG